MLPVENNEGFARPKLQAQPYATQPKQKVLRSKKLYWIVGTFAVVAAALSFYYLVYVSSQQAYYTERSFRLLSSMADKLVLDTDIVRNVLAAAASKETVDDANEYVEEALHGTLEHRDFVVTHLRKVNARNLTSHTGLLTLFPPETGSGPFIRADYREPRTGEPVIIPCVGEPAEDKTAAKTPNKPGSPEIVVCATVDFSSLVRPAVQQLGQDFFQDVLIADSTGQ